MQRTLENLAGIATLNLVVETARDMRKTLKMQEEIVADGPGSLRTLEVLLALLNNSPRQEWIEMLKGVGRRAKELRFVLRIDPECQCPEQCEQTIKDEVTQVLCELLGCDC